ncbi:MAG TPA: ABC transporter permease [Usitatibacter sp.]|jgi:peptide/nickel transport system permease protein|nr:ABC transporter permease [Usitatibacter sp.]
MLRYALRRGLLAIAVAITVSVATFFLLNFATDPAQSLAGEDAPPEVVEQIRQEYGFDKPIPVQYLHWLAAVAHGDFGQSYHWRSPVGALIASHAPVTIRLALMAILVTMVVAIPLGAIAALRPNSFIDRLALSVAVSAQAVPGFWLGLVLIIVFAVKFPIFPVSGDATWKHFVLPAIVLGASSIPAVMRLTRSGLLDVLGSDYIRTARAKGFHGMPLLLRHAMRNALLPVVSVLAVQLGTKLGGSVVVESVFALNGLGRLALQSILGGDVPTVQILVFVFAITFVVLTFVADLLGAWLDPRIRLG